MPGATILESVPYGEFWELGTPLLADSQMAELNGHQRNSEMTYKSS